MKLSVIYVWRLPCYPNCLASGERRTKIHGGPRRPYDKIKQGRKKLVPHKFKFYINKRYKFKEENYINKSSKHTIQFLLIELELCMPCRMLISTKSGGVGKGTMSGDVSGLELRFISLPSSSAARTGCIIATSEIEPAERANVATTSGTRVPR
jgi:hypothetical protein